MTLSQAVKESTQIIERDRLLAGDAPGGECTATPTSSGSKTPPAIDSRLPVAPRIVQRRWAGALVVGKRRIADKQKSIAFLRLKYYSEGMKMEYRKKYTLTLEPSVVEKFREQAHSLGYRLSTFVNHVMRKTVGMCGDADMPEKENPMESQDDD